MVIILLGTGLRISEFAALTVDDVDFENNMIHVNKQLKKLQQRTIIDRPKTPNAVRNIPMTKAVRESLTHLVEERRKNPNTCMSDGVSGFLSVTRNGRPRCHSEYDDAMRAFMARYNEQTDIPIERCTPHVLRHTYCTRCIAAGIDIKSAQYLMGHADVSTTLNIYADIVFDKVIASVDLLDQKSS
jgi:integrase